MSKPHKEDRTEWVSPKKIRQIFNELGLYEKVANGDYTSHVIVNRHLKHPPKTEPICTHSQILFYYDEKKKPVAIVHQYMRPDGTLGASGKPDPKKIFIGTKVLGTKG